jgi:hypothetical protein
MKCRVKGCGSESVTRGYCNMHYRRWLKRGFTGSPLPKFRKLTDTEDKKMIRLYRKLSSTRKVADELGVNPETVRRHLADLGVELVPPGSGTALDVNERFFDKWSPEMAWCLGLLWTDGHMSKDGSVELVSKDREMLVKFRKLISGEQRITKCEDRRNDYTWHRYRFGSVNIAATLHKRGMKTRKSLTAGFPKVPEKYLSHFVRGVFDGDGSVYWVKRDKVPQVSFATSSQRMKNDLVKVLERRGYRVHASLDTKLSHERRGPSKVIGHCWKVTINRLDDIGRFNAWIYRGSSEGTRLERKHRTFDKLMERYLNKWGV